jgi:hypothetical protein
MFNIVLAAGKKVVEAYHLITFLQQSFAKMATNEAGSTGNQNSFCHISLRECRARSVEIFQIGKIIKIIRLVMSRLESHSHNHCESFVFAVIGSFIRARCHPLSPAGGFPVSHTLSFVER